MKQTLWLGSLLVVPLAAALLWLGGSDDRSRKVASRSSVVSIDDRALPERLDVAKREARPDLLSRGDVRHAAPQDEMEVESPPEIPEDEMDDESDLIEKDRRIRLPVILAIRGNHTSSEARREAMLDALRNSGPSDEPWTRKSTAVFGDWTGGISSDVGLHADFTNPQCYQAGCEVELSFPDRASYDRAAEKFRSFQEDNATHGGRVQTPPVEGDDGQMRASWIMLRPDRSES